MAGREPVNGGPRACQWRAANLSVAAPGNLVNVPHEARMRRRGTFTSWGVVNVPPVVVTASIGTLTMPAAPRWIVPGASHSWS